MSTKETIYNKIQNLLDTNVKGPVIVAIDGRCGSGKTTLALCLSKKLCCPVVHMDDFFLPPAKRTEQRLAKAGENIDHERFLSEVLIPLKQGKTAHFCPFDCSKSDYGPQKTVDGKLIIVEGSYSCHLNLWPLYDLRIFCDIDAKTQLQRIIKRDGIEKASVFESRWIPMEEKYFEKFNVSQRCDIIYLG